MDSAKIFALGLAAGLAVHYVVRNNSGKKAQKEAAHNEGKSQGSGSIASSKSSASKNKKNKKKAKDTASAPEPVEEVVKEQPAAPAPAAVKEEATATPAAASAKKNKKKQKAQQKELAAAAPGHESYAEVASEDAAPGGAAITNDAIRAKADAAQTAFTSSLGDMRDAEVDPLPSGYSSVARIPAPEVEAPKPKLSKKELDDGWSSVGGSSATFSSTAAKGNSTTTAVKPNGVSGTKPSIASNNPFAALPDDATTSSVRRIPAKPASTKPASNGWTVASASGKAKSNANVVGNGVETKKQRSNANKAAAKKAAKEEADRLQEERLANHRRQQALEQAKAREAARRPTPNSVPGSSKAPTAKASVDLNGRLVWD